MRRGGCRLGNGLKRGTIVTLAAGEGYAGKPRPADDRFDATDSLTLCLFTSTPVEAPLIRLLVEPSNTNGLKEPSYLMVDKIVTIQRSQINREVGRLAYEVLYG